MPVVSYPSAFSTVLDFRVLIPKLMDSPFAKWEQSVVSAGRHKPPSGQYEKENTNGQMRQLFRVLLIAAVTWLELLTVSGSEINLNE